MKLQLLRTTTIGVVMQSESSFSSSSSRLSLSLMLFIGVYDIDNVLFFVIYAYQRIILTFQPYDILLHTMDKIKHHKVSPFNNYKTAIIKLAGNMKENIGELLLQVDCTCGAKQEFEKILSVYGDKIQKLRCQRNELKQQCRSLKQQFNELNSQLLPIREEVQKKIQNVYNINDQIVNILPVQGKREKEGEGEFKKSVNEETLLLEMDSAVFLPQPQTPKKQDLQTPKKSQSNETPKKFMSFDRFIEDKMKKKLTKQKIKEDLKVLQQHNSNRKPLNDHSNIRY